MKKILLFFLTLFIVGLVALSIYLRNFPEKLEFYLEEVIGNQISIERIEYQYPFVVTLYNTSIQDPDFSENEDLFFAEKITLRINFKSLFDKKVYISALDIKNPRLSIYKKKSKWIYPVKKKRGDGLILSNLTTELSAINDKKIPILIEQVYISRGFIRFIDYDISEDGFSLILQDVSGNIQNFNSSKLSAPFNFRGNIFQGRDIPPIRFQSAGEGNFLNGSAGMRLRFQEVWLPYFNSYIDQAAAFTFSDGVGVFDSNIEIKNKKVTSINHISLRRLYFNNISLNSKILNIDASQILNLLEQSNRRLNIDFRLEWPLNSSKYKFISLLKSAAETSLKERIVSKIDTLISDTMQESKMESDPNLSSEELDRLFEPEDETVVEKIIDFLDTKN